MLTISWDRLHDLKNHWKRKVFSSQIEMVHLMCRSGSRLVIEYLVILGGASLACNAATGATPSTELPEPSKIVTSQPPPNWEVAAPSDGRIGCENLVTEFVTDLDLRQTPSLPELDPRTPFRDPEFGTCLIRVTDRRSDISSDDVSLGLKNEYSRVQSFNVDGSKFIIRGTDGTWYLYDAFSLLPLEQLFLDSDPRWDASDSNLLYFSEESRLMAIDLRSGETTVVHEFAGDFPGETLAAVWSRYEGSPSIDGRYWGFMAQDADWRVVSLVVYDLVEDRVIARRDISGDPEIDSVTISPLGTYLLAYLDYCEPGTMGTIAQPCGLMVYDRSLEEGRGLLRIIGHSDTALDAEGREVLVYQDIDTDHISMLDLESGTVTPLWPIDFSHSPLGFHFSGRATQVPGWVLVSTASGGHPTDYTWMDDSVFAIELRENGEIVRLAHTHSLVDEDQEHDYWAEPHATVNPDFSRILFTSNWGRSGSSEVETFMIQLPENSIDDGH